MTRLQTGQVWRRLCQGPVVAGVPPANFPKTAADTACLYNYDFRRTRAMRLAIQPMKMTAIAQGARNATATPIMRKLHMIAAALCANVRRSVATRPVSDETMLPWL